jgi:NTE family protein
MRGQPDILLKIVLMAILVTSNLCLAQTGRPKIGLVLSGGGAKGIAHVRVLQVLDSLGIVPDYIAGTSMGSVVGALYATGYTGHQIDSITKVIEWNKMFSNSVAFSEINIEEKDEFGRYIYELPLNGLTPQFPLGVVEGQQIEELLASLFFQVKTITDFNRLPTPFLCVAADIVKGEPVILRKGSLAAAVRASMSIPTVFSPVRIDGRLLVDGGVYMNLPVTYCREMGADYIIAVDVGGGLYKEEELTSAASMLVQTTFLSGNISYQQEREKSDIFVDVVKHLKYSTMDFEQGPAMMKSGDQAVKEVMAQLVNLSDQMKAYPKRVVKPVKQIQDRYKLQTIEMAGVSAANKDFVLERFGWQSGDQVSREQIATSVHKLLGTRLFSKINYTIEGDSVQSTLTLRANEKPANAVKFGIHYDTDRGAGVILNFTKRNLLLPSSRFLATLNLAETPRVRVNYFYYLGKRSHWWHQTELYAENVALNTFVEGTPIPDVVSRHFSAVTNFNYSLNEKSFWGLGGFWQTNLIKPKIDPRSEVNPDEIELINYQLTTAGPKLHFQFNTYDKVFFPTQGAWLRAEVLANFGNAMEAQLYFSSPDTVLDYTIQGHVQNYLRFNLRTQKNVTLSNKTTLQLKGQFGFTQEISSAESRYSAYQFAAGDFIYVGGQIQRPRSTIFNYTGLKEAEVAVPQVMIAGVDLQIALLKNVYVTPSLNIMAAGYDSSDFWQSLGDFDFSGDSQDKAFYQIGYGVTGAYMSLLGPISVTVSEDSQVDKLRWFFSLGFTF